MNETITTNAVTATEAKRPSKPKRNDMEKLAECYAKRDKTAEQQNAKINESKKLGERLSKYNSTIQQLENREIVRLCKKLNITTKDLIEFLDKIPKGTSFDEIANRVFQDTSNNSGGIT
ncbi:hypothetical protein [Huintestinicola sp.]